MDAYRIPSGVRDISGEVLNGDGRMRILPASYWASVTRDERARFCLTQGVYSIPTVELVERLRKMIAGRSAIEIGAGNGVLAEALGIPATDSRQQEKEPYRSLYVATKQTPVPYGDNVVEMDAYTAVRHYKPKVVIGCWVSHKYDSTRHTAGGNEVGVDEVDIIRRCSTYIFVGNEHVHRRKPIWQMKHQIDFPSYLYSRKMSDAKNFIAVWRGGKK